MLDMVCETIEALAKPIDNDHKPAAGQHETGAIQHVSSKTVNHDMAADVCHNATSSTSFPTLADILPCASRIAPPAAKHKRYDLDQPASFVPV